jgi:GntR family transcriptional regulator, arabinose operon transcriptional repressor
MEEDGMKAPINNPKPLYQRLVDDIAAHIDVGKWPVGDKLPSEKALCEMYEVSQITVRRALRELTQAGYVYSHHGLGWFVGNRASPAMPHRDITLISPELDAVTAQLVPPLIAALRPEFALRLAFLDGGPATSEEALRQAVAAGAAAVLLAVAGDERHLQERYRHLLAGAGVPVALLWRAVPNVEAPTVILDEAGAMQRLTEYLLQLGHRRVAYVGADPSLAEGQRRYLGFANTIWEHGQELPMEWVFAGQLTDRPDGARFQRIFGGTDRPTAIACASDYHAAEAMSLLSQLEVKCPDDVAVVGLGDLAFAPLLPASLTSFRFDMVKMASATASMLRALVAGQKAESVTISGEIIERQSCGISHARAM